MIFGVPFPLISFDVDFELVLSPDDIMPTWGSWNLVLGAPLLWLGRYGTSCDAPIRVSDDIAWGTL